MEKESGMSKAKLFVLALMIFLGAPSVNAQNATTSPAQANSGQVRIRSIVNDVPAAMTFYSRLGFRLDAQSGPYFAALSRSGVQLLLSPTAGPGGASQPMPNGDKPAPGGWNRLVLDTP